MKPLNPLYDKDRRITAYTNTFFIEEYRRDTIRIGIDSFDCWGKQQGGTHIFTTTPAYLKKVAGFQSYVTLELMQRGCCTIIKQELAEIAEAGAD